MTSGIPFRRLLLALLLIPALLSGCGGSSEDKNIPYTVEVWNQHSIVFGNAGAVKTSGYNAYGQLGDGTRENRFQAVTVPLQNVAGFSAGATHTLAFTSTGTVFAWGFNSHGQLGNAGIPTSSKSRTDDYSATPVAVDTLAGVTSVGAGSLHSLAAAGGKVYSWGSNDYAQLGYQASSVNNVPKEVPGLDNVTQVAAGGVHSLALTADGKVYAWGDNKVGQLGPAANAQSTSVAPVQVPFPALPDGVVPVEIAAGGGFSVVRMSNGTVWAWGHNEYGQAGRIPIKAAAGEPFEGQFVAVEPAPVALPQGLRATAIAAGKGHALALMEDGTAWAWGFNERGQLGNNPYINLEKGPSPNSHLPVQMLMGGTERSGSGTPADGVERVQAIGNSSFATRRSSATGLVEIWGWGENSFGQLGVPRDDDRVGYRLVPVRMGGI